LVLRELVTLLKRNGYDININNKNNKLIEDKGYETFMKKDFFNDFLANKSHAEIAKTFFTITNSTQLTSKTQLTNENAEDNFKLRVQAILGDPNDPNNIHNRVTDGDQTNWLKQVVESLSTRPTNDKYSERFLTVLEATTRKWTLFEGKLYKADDATKINETGFASALNPNSKPLTKKEFYDLFFGKKNIGTAETRIAVSTTERLLNKKPGIFENMFRGGKKTLKKHGDKKHGDKKHGGKNTRKNIYNMTIKKTNKKHQNTTHKNQ
jgi:hypothetical protein